MKTIIEAISQFIQHLVPDASLTFTLTMKQALRKNDYGAWVRLDQISASENIRHFLNALNRRIYNNAYIRYKKRVGCIVAIEKGEREDKRYHAHITFKKPDHLSVDTFSKYVYQAWHQTDWAYTDVHHRDAGHKWSQYLSKEGHDAIDFVNCHPST